ncbi:lactoylglutathione lyase-like lyase [Clostridium pasteurianum DSM 525 = ATCC 6013]|uniref:Glyoxalase-like domain containing protein n=1 Tax=Clostridium pasteurianum DSM 525 = ATCC 6013 TaxID=1262449 RepID=A0A0H3J0Z8_CLOPA|nr:VOC family protein [Clostridium pasteurianum]AJA47029.1 lactoylglutathione lyase-like lyase [Clostridium pasteurianum DSM 525 = ATCC 6013]AJA51017.1 lactoylglutathione lyase-like lyase [Clostridium pasteurianum DSM 525 = ATCC 6013]AOZ74400.1 glyoxalase [Clostridium pasteurianum DSM 525 = ATCC 6013]AOZ78197.1 glyoxalase [Clostridium pasteurianum]ELP57488.1 lactoylglutathione lyase-like lyase [Clostridium pasteurianum DSM 525 = ATCC 6013]
MKFLNPLIVVSDLEKSKRFYYEVLGLEIVLDFGANVTLTGGIALQTKDTWSTFIHKNDNEIVFGGNVAELYFEEDDFDVFIQKINDIAGINYVHTILEHSWGQRVVRFYDPDNHIIEVGENMIMVVRRFLKSGLSIEETAIRMDVPVDYVKSCLG